MTRHRRVVVAAALCAALPVALPAQSFEGKLRFRTVELPLDEGETLRESLLDVPVATLLQREEAEVSDATILIKGKLMRSEGGPEAQGAYSLWDLERDLIWIVQPAERAYMELRPEVAPPAGSPDPALKVRALGQTRTINGMRTAGYEVRGADFVLRAWMTHDHPGLTWAFRRAAGREQEHDDPLDAAAALLTRHGFPVLLQMLTPTSLAIDETVSVERAALGDDLFRVPAGFRKVAMPERP